MAANRLIKFLKDNETYIDMYRPTGVDLYNKNFFDDVFITVTTKISSSNNYLLIEYEDNKEENDCK